jgi:hypothetical protein
VASLASLLIYRLDSQNLIPSKAEGEERDPTSRETGPATFFPNSYVTDETPWKVESSLKEQAVSLVAEKYRTYI